MAGSHADPSGRNSHRYPVNHLQSGLFPAHHPPQRILRHEYHSSAVPAMPYGRPCGMSRRCWLPSTIRTHCLNCYQKNRSTTCSGSRHLWSSWHCHCPANSSFQYRKPTLWCWSACRFGRRCLSASAVPFGTTLPVSAL